MSEVKETPVDQTKTVIIAIVLLLVIAVSSVAIRMLSDDGSSLPGGDTAWNITITHEVEVLEDGGSLLVSPPWGTRYARLYSQTLTHPGFQQIRSKKKNQRDIKLVAHQAGHYRVDTEFRISLSALTRGEPKSYKLSEANRSKWLAPSENILSNSTLAFTIVDAYGKEFTSPRELIEKLFNYVSGHIKVRDDASDESEAALFENKATAKGLNNALIALLRASHLPSRLVIGVDLNATEQPTYWVEVFTGLRWLFLDPVYGRIDDMPAAFIPIRKGEGSLVITEGVKVNVTDWNIEQTSLLSEMVTDESRNIADVLNLDRLAPQNRENLGFLLLLPIGVLATELLRQLLGIRTYGTFTPSLMALAVVHSDWRTASIVFALVMIVGIIIRSMMPTLHLDRTARLAIVFTLVSMCMAFVMSSFIFIDPTVDSGVVLLPVVVLTMLVDRIYSIADQNGTDVAMKRLAWTILSAALSLLVLLQSELSLMFVSYPELHAVTLALIFIVGLYKGKKLCDVEGFTWISEPVRPKRKVKDT